jgi:hypothetical protein
LHADNYAEFDIRQACGVRRAVSDLTLEKLVLKEVASGKF